MFLLFQTISHDESTMTLGVHGASNGYFKRVIVFKFSWLVQNKEILRFRFSSNFTRRFQFMVRERVEWLRATLVARWMPGVVFSMHGRAGAYVTSKWGRNDVQMGCK